MSVWGSRWLIGSVVLFVSVACGGTDEERQGPRAVGAAGDASAGDGGSDGGPGGAGGQPTNPDPEPATCDCDDGVACTLDECVNDECVHTVQHFQCVGGSYCSPTEGCVNGAPCATADDCERPDPCVVVACNKKYARCFYEYLDSDGDGEAPVACGGQDCNDAEFSVHSDAPETCDGLDNDCDGVIDPPKQSACLDSESCVASSCVCDDPLSLCRLAGPVDAHECFDLSRDPSHCGACGRACADLEICESGTCQCEEPFIDCFGTCRDPRTDSNNCGACDVRCNDATCNAGECTCPAQEENCGTTDNFDCRDSQTDPKHCGQCGWTCSGASGCGDGECDTDVEVLGLYGGAKQPGFSFGSVSIASSPTGDIFTAVFAGGTPWRALPGGQDDVFGPYTTVAKLDTQANVVWSVELPGINAMAPAGSHLWVAVQSSEDMTIAGTAFTKGENRQGFIALVKLDGSTGEVLAHDQLDYEGQAAIIGMVADADNLWLTATLDLPVHHGGATFTPPDTGPYFSFLYRLGLDSPRWLPGYPDAPTLTPDGKVFVAVMAEPGKNLTLGGAPFSPTKRFGQPAFARYTQALVHEASALMPATYPTSTVAADSSALYWLDVAGAAGIFEETDYAGAKLETAGSKAPVPFDGMSLKVEGSKLLSVATAEQAGGEFEGRTIPAKATALLAFDKDSKAVTGSIAFQSFINDDGYTGYPGGYALSPDGKSAIVATTFYDGIAIPGRPSTMAAGSYGVAFLKVTFER